MELPNCHQQHLFILMIIFRGTPQLDDLSDRILRVSNSVIFQGTMQSIINCFQLYIFFLFTNNDDKNLMVTIIIIIIIIIIIMSNRDAAVSQSVRLVAEGSRVRGYGSCNEILATGLLIHKMRTRQDVMAMCLSNALRLNWQYRLYTSLGVKVSAGLKQM